MAKTASKARDRSKYLILMTNWAAFSVLIPMLVYPTAAAIGLLAGQPLDWKEAIAKGDMLFLVVVLLSTMIGTSVTELLFTPQNQASQQWLKYLSLVFAMMSVLVYAMIYGWLITTRMEGGPEISNPASLAWFSLASIISYALFCGVSFFATLQSNRL